MSVCQARRKRKVTWKETKMGFKPAISEFARRSKTPIFMCLFFRLFVCFTIKEELSRVKLILGEVTENAKNCTEFEVIG
jgi:hypothetical protein